MMPWRLTDSARPDPASPSKRFLGCLGFGWIASTGISSSSLAAASPPPTRTSRPRPRPRRLGTLDKLHRHLPVCVSAGGAAVVRDRGEPVARRLGEPDRAGNGLREDERAEVLPHLRRDLLREPGARIDHREENAADAERR